MIYQIRYLHHFYVFYHYHQFQKGSYIGIVILAHQRGATPVGKTTLFSHIPNIFAVNILSKTGKIPSLIAFYKLFLSVIKVKISVFRIRKVLNWYIHWEVSLILDLQLLSFKFSNVSVPAETAVILSGIWVVLWPELPKMLSILFEIFDQ